MADDIEAMIRTTIQAKVIEAFNAAPEAIEKLIAAALEQKVDQYGMKPEGYRRDEAIPYLDWLVGSEIRMATQGAVREYITEHKETIKAQIAQAIGKADFASAIGERMADVLAEDHRWSVDVTRKSS